MMYQIPRSKKITSLALVAFLILGVSLTLEAHTIRGVNRSTEATARIESPTANIVDFPIPLVVDENGNPLLSVACFRVRNSSPPPQDSRITAFGFDLPGELTDFELVDPNNFNIVLESYLNFTLENEVERIPGFQGITLDFALLTGRTFGGGRPNKGLAPSSVLTTFCVRGPFPAVPIENMIDNSYVRFQRVGTSGEFSDVGIWERRL